MKLKPRRKAVRVDALDTRINSIMFAAQVTGTPSRARMCDNWQTYIGAAQGEPDLLRNLHRRGASVTIPGLDGFPDLPALDYTRSLRRFLRPA